QDLVALAAGVPHKLQTRWYVVKKLAHGECCTAQTGLPPMLDGLASSYHNICPGLFSLVLLSFCGQAQQRQLRDGGNAGQGFAAKAQSVQMIQVLNSADFAGAVARTGRLQFLGGDSHSVITHAYKIQPTTTYLYPHFARSGVQSVFQQFFDD